MLRFQFFAATVAPEYAGALKLIFMSGLQVNCAIPYHQRVRINSAALQQIPELFRFCLSCKGAADEVKETD